MYKRQSISWAILAGIAVGVVSAIRQYSAFDNISMLVVLLALSIPHFWLGLVLEMCIRDRCQL